jgi:hypothetical protein
MVVTLPPQWTESHNSICIFKSCLESVQSEKSKRASAKQQMVIWSDLQRLAILRQGSIYFVPLDKLIALLPQSRRTNLFRPPLFRQPFHQDVRL